MPRAFRPSKLLSYSGGRVFTRIKYNCNDYKHTRRLDVEVRAGGPVVSSVDQGWQVNGNILIALVKLSLIDLR